MFQVSPLKFRAVPHLLGTLALLSINAFAHADNLVSDGGFESAGGGNTYYAGSSIDGGNWNVTLGSVYIDANDPYVYAGNNSLNLGAANFFTANTVAQVLATVVGDTYSVSFYGDADSPNTFSVTENGTVVTGTPGSIVDNGFPNSTNSSLFVDYTGTFVANSTSTTLDLTAVSDPSLLDPSQSGSVVIDGVSVQLAPTPEPVSIVLMLTGMAGLGLLAAKKRLAGFGVAD